MTSSSFGTIVGRERDKIPGYGVPNYKETEPDLTDEVNAQINKNQQDTIEFYNEMAQIQKDIAETPLKNLESLAQFSSSASRAIETFQERRRVQEDINIAMDFLDSNSTAELNQKQGQFELENSRFQNQLMNEEGDLKDPAQNLLNNLNVEFPEDVSIRQFFRIYNENGIGARNQFLNESGAQDISDLDTFIELHNAADELMLTNLYRRARALGIDTNSREFRKAFYNTIYPDIKKRRENNIQSWKANANRNFNRLNKKKTRKIIVDTLKPYTEGAQVDVDVMTLVETVQNRMNFKTPKEAIQYIFSEVAAVSAEPERELDLYHLEYLFDGAIFEHSATKQKTTIADGDFKFKNGLQNIMQDAEIERARDVQNGINADNILANQEYEALKDQYPNGIPPGIEAEFLRDTERKYPHFDATKLNSNNASITTGGEYSGQAGQPDATIDYRERLETNWVKLKGDLAPTPENTFELNRAYGEFKRRVANQIAVGVEPDVASETQYKIVQNLLNEGAFEAKAVEAREGREIEPADILADSKLFRADPNKVRFNSSFNSLAEQRALIEYKKFKLYGEPFPTYFKGVTRGTNVSATQYAEDRFRSMNGYNDLGEVAERFTVDPESGLLVDKQFGMTQEQLNQFEINPHLTKTYTQLEQNPKLAERILKGFHKKGNVVGTYQPAIGFGRINGDTKTVGEMLTYGERGASNFGLFGFTYQELKEATKSGVISKDAIFDENTQTQMVFELLRQRANRTNSIRGAIIQAEFGGERTVFEGDEDIGRWDRLINLTQGEKDTILQVFPLLRNTPANQFHNLTGGVVLEIEKLIDEGKLSTQSKKEKEQLLEEMTGTKDKELQKKILENKSTEAFGGLPG